MSGHQRERGDSIFKGAKGKNAGAELSEQGGARRSFLGRIGRSSAALAMLGLGGEVLLRAFSNRSAMSSAAAGGDSRLLFASNFEGNVQFGAPYSCGSTSCYQKIEGYDQTTGFDWANFATPINADYRGHLIVGTTFTNISDYHDNQVMTTIGRHGTETRAARFKIIETPTGAAQNTFGYFRSNVEPGTERMYWRYWIRMEADLVDKMGLSGWVSFWSWKIGTSTYRLTAQIWTTSSGVPRWMIQGDSGAGTSDYVRHFRVFNDVVPIPQGEWAKVEVFYDRNGSGRVWTAINGQVLWDIVPKDPLGRLDRNITNGTFLTVRGTSSRDTTAREVWVDELEIWDNFPPESSNRLAPPVAPAKVDVSEVQRLGGIG